MKKFLCLLMSLIMVFTLTPMTAFAESGGVQTPSVKVEIWGEVSSNTDTEDFNLTDYSGSAAALWDDVQEYVSETNVAPGETKNITITVNEDLNIMKDYDRSTHGDSSYDDFDFGDLYNTNLTIVLNNGSNIWARNGMVNLVSDSNLTIIGSGLDSGIFFDSICNYGPLSVIGYSGWTGSNLYLQENCTLEIKNAALNSDMELFRYAKATFSDCIVLGRITAVSDTEFVFNNAVVEDVRDVLGKVKCLGFVRVGNLLGSNVACEGTCSSIDNTYGDYYDVEGEYPYFTNFDVSGADPESVIYVPDKEKLDPALQENPIFEECILGFDHFSDDDLCTYTDCSHLTLNIGDIILNGSNQSLDGTDLNIEIAGVEGGKFQKITQALTEIQNYITDSHEADLYTSYSGKQGLYYKEEFDFLLECWNGSQLKKDASDTDYKAFDEIKAFAKDNIFTENGTLSVSATESALTVKLLGFIEICFDSTKGTLTVNVNDLGETLDDLAKATQSDIIKDLDAFALKLEPLALDLNSNTKIVKDLVFEITADEDDKFDDFELSNDDIKIFFEGEGNNPDDNPSFVDGMAEELSDMIDGYLGEAEGETYSQKAYSYVNEILSAGENNFVYLAENFRDGDTSAAAATLPTATDFSSDRKFSILAGDGLVDMLSENVGGEPPVTVTDFTEEKVDVSFEDPGRENAAGYEINSFAKKLFSLDNDSMISNILDDGNFEVQRFSQAHLNTPLCLNKTGDNYDFVKVGNVIVTAAQNNRHPSYDPEAYQKIMEEIAEEQETKKIAAAKDAVDNTVLKAVAIKQTKLHGKKAVKVTWSVIGGVYELRDFEGFDVYRSTKKSSGYGTKPFFTTTKWSYINNKDIKVGQTYYYKVRAWKTIDGKKYYTDWSTKAKRTVK